MDIKRALKLYRPPIPNVMVAAVDRWIIVLSSVAVALAATLLIGVLRSDARLEPQAALGAEWTAVFENLGDCARAVKVDANCPASPLQEKLWRSPITRDSDEFRARARGVEAPYWLGMVIPAATLARAADRKAQILVFKTVRGVSDIWIDGFLQTNHRYVEQSAPAQVSLSEARLREGKDMYVAIRVLPYPFYSVVREKAQAEGFFTAVAADRLARWRVFSGLALNLLAFGFFILLARILWRASAARRMNYDYIAGAQFALVLALISAVSIDLSLRWMTVFEYYRLCFVLYVWEAVFLVRLTLSFLRATRASSIAQAMTLLVASVALFVFTPALWIERTGMTLMTTYVFPLVYGLSALALGYRAWEMLKQKRASGPASAERVEFLFLSFYCVGATAIAYLWEASRSHGIEVQWSRWLNLATVYLLVRLATRREAIVIQSGLASSAEAREEKLERKAA